MVRISILVVEDSFETAIFPTLDLLEHANEYLLETIGEKMFDVKMVGFKKKKILLSKHTTVHCDQTIREELQHDILIIPGFDIRRIEFIDWEQYRPLTQWLVEQHRKGVKIGTMCLGAILLAQTGLLTGVECTTHWQGCDFMKKKFPDVHLSPSEVITHNNGIYTSGGAFSSIQLILFFIEKHCGKEVANYIAKMTAIDYPLKTQNQFYIFDQQKNHFDKTIISAQDFMEKNYDQNIKMQDLSKISNMSVRNFIRRFKKATGDTPIEYLQKIRIEAAKAEFENGNSSVSNVMYNSGYKDIKSFGMLFKRMTGMTPSAYSKRFNTATMH